jgi:putative tricarboxylic transport membrane protein
MGGHITVAVTRPGDPRPAQTGKIRIIAIPGIPRGGPWPMCRPEGQGVDAVFSTWRVIVGPKGMTPEQIAWWDNTLAKVTASPDGRPRWVATSGPRII